MNIGFFTNVYLPINWGITTLIENYREELEKQGHNVFIFAAEHPGYQDKNPNVFRFKSIDLNYKISYPLPIISSPQIRKVIKKLDLDIIHSHHFFFCGQLAWYYAKKFNLPLVFTYHTRYDLYTHYAPLPKELAKSLAQSLSTFYANSCDAVISPTESIKDLLLEYKVKKPIFVIPSGVDINEFQDTDDKKIREKYNIDQNKILFLTVSRLGPEKNISFLLRAFQKINKVRKDTHLMIVGDGSEKENLEKESKELGLSEKIIFTGRVPNQKIPLYYAAADIFLFSSLSETQGVIFVEAMSRGIPTVAIKANGVKDIIISGETGILTSDNTDTFSQAALKLVDNENLREKMSEKAKEEAQNFSIERSTEKLLSFYQKTIEQKKEKTRLSKKIEKNSCKLYNKNKKGE